MKKYSLIMAMSGLLLINTALADFSQRIVGGVDTDHSEVSFIASLQDSGDHVCGGSLIAPEWVLTAAHCFFFTQPDTIVIGATDLRKAKTKQTFSIQNIFIHPEYDNTSHDMALVQLSSSAPFHGIPLNTRDLSRQSDILMTTAGWGALNENSAQSSPILQSVEVPLIHRDQCEELLQNLIPSEQAHIDESMLCAGYEQGQKDACQGDSGGPLFYHHPNTNEKILVGVVSWGVGCAREESPGVYANVHMFTDWIEDVIGGEQELLVAGH